MGCRKVFSDRRVFVFNNTLVEVSSCKANNYGVVKIMCVHHFYKSEMYLKFVIHQAPMQGMKCCKVPLTSHTVVLAWGVILPSC